MARITRISGQGDGERPGLSTSVTDVSRAISAHAQQRTASPRKQRIIYDSDDDFIPDTAPSRGKPSAVDDTDTSDTSESSNEAVDEDSDHSFYSARDGLATTSGNSTTTPEDSDPELPSPRQFVHRRRAKQPPPQQTVVHTELDLIEMNDSSSRRFQRSTASEARDLRPSTPDSQLDADAVLSFIPAQARKPHVAVRPTTPERQSDSRSKILSPSKRKVRIPTPPGRPSLANFWDVEAINGWNDQFSPRKEWQSPKKEASSLLTNPASPISSPQKMTSPTKRSKVALERRKRWDSTKNDTAARFLSELDRVITNGQIEALSASTGGVKIIWSKTLKSTAGRALWRRETSKLAHANNAAAETTYRHFASIELAEKVIDDEERLLNVLGHEFCHLCNFMISGVKDQPHGRQFKDWGRKVTAAFADRGVEVTTKHSYRIDFKYIWQCSSAGCLTEFKRHSKSIDLERHTCGVCRSRLIQIKPVPRKTAGGEPTGYAAYVKEHFAAVKRGMPGASHKEVMGAVAKQYHAEKTAVALAMPGDCSDFDSGMIGNSSSLPDSSLDCIARQLESVTL